MVIELGKGREVQIPAPGNSMAPLVKNGQRIVLSPIEGEAEKGDIVLAKISGHYYIHKVSGIRRTKSSILYQISNQSGHVNGWTNQVYGKVTKIGD